MTKNHFTTLQKDHPLFQKLKHDNPPWWQFVKNNIKLGGVYVDIRKDNSLNVYHNGGSMLKIKLSRNDINCNIHPSYLNIVAKNNVKYDPNNLPNDFDKIKTKIASKFSNTSESGIQASLILATDAKYIDSEYAYPEINGKKINKKGIEENNYKTTRIDLTKIEDGKIIFVELKKIDDGRLITKDYENGNPEILSQMSSYNQFVKNHRKEIENYYKILFSIKRDLAILPNNLADIDNIDNYVLSEDVELYFDLSAYSFLNTQRTNRINAIKTLLDNNNIIHNL